MALAVAEAKADGVNPRTAAKDNFAEREFNLYAQLRGFDPDLQSSWLHRFPQRENLKHAGFLLFRAQRAKPRSKGDVVAKPMSIFQNYLALRRVFRQRGVDMPSTTSVRDTLKGLIQRAKRRFGIEWLRKKQVEPVTPPMIRKAVHIAHGGERRINTLLWSIPNWVCFIVTAWMVINLQVGSRKGESTRLPGDVDHNDWFTRKSLTFIIGGRVVVDPTEEQLNAMKEGDKARLAPKGAKCDQYGTCHGTEPIVMPFHDDELNPARWLRDIELRWPCHGADRERLPLFCDEHGQPFTDSRFASYINAVIAMVVGPERAKLFSPHSWRVWLASALRMRNAQDGLIMAFGRWLNPESVKIYARLGVDEYCHWMDEIMKVNHIDAARTTNLPCMDAADALAGWDDALGDDFDSKAPEGPSPPLPKGTRISVFWTDMEEWYRGTVTSSRMDSTDDGTKYRATRIVYDSVGAWRTQRSYWHSLDDEHYELIAEV